MLYELNYRGWDGVNDDWEWHPELLWARARWEDQLVAGLELAVPRGGPTGATDPTTGAHLYGTTGSFLERMGMTSLDDLPPLAPYLPDLDVLDDVDGTGVPAAPAGTVPATQNEEQQ